MFSIRKSPRDYCWDFIGCVFSFNRNSGLCSLSETEKVLWMSLKIEIYCAVYEHHQKNMYALLDNLYS